MISPMERARMLDAEMRLQRAWLELSLREIKASAGESAWSKLKPFKLGLLGLSFLKNRSLWLAGISMLVNVYRRYTKKEKS